MDQAQLPLTFSSSLLRLSKLDSLSKNLNLVLNLANQQRYKPVIWEKKINNSDASLFPIFVMFQYYTQMIDIVHRNQLPKT